MRFKAQHAAEINIQPVVLRTWITADQEIVEDGDAGKPMED